MKLFIKNMVCDRCKSAVKTTLEQNKLTPINIALGEVEIMEEDIPAQSLMHLDAALKEIGFELIDKSKGKVVEKIKNLLVDLIHHSATRQTLKYSELISQELHYDYPYLSNLFSTQVGVTIEQYIILQKVEKIKEYIVYEELSLNEIADKMGYSSVAHLSAQFKKVTGMPPSRFKNLGIHQRKTIDVIGM